VIDWEFAGVADPRLDLARLCVRRRFEGDVTVTDTGSDEDTDALWAAYATRRFGDMGASMLGPWRPWVVR
jgi:aminoglycoside phosphotransferase (APT) family kinase protein